MPFEVSNSMNDETQKQNKFSLLEDEPVDKRTLDRVLKVIEQSYAIQTHADYFKWLQNGVQSFIPHHVLLACWGRFNKTHKNQQLHYDAASTIAEINTQGILDVAGDSDKFMRHLHQTWCQNNRRWFVINNIGSLPESHPLKPTFLNATANLNSLLVYGVSDIRSSSECLYVFFNHQTEFAIQHYVMGYLMPHIDNVLRRIQHITQVDVNPVLSANILLLATLTEREIEIIEWIKSGKTNQEIGLILHISQNTVKSHLKRIFQKLNVSRRAQAVAMLGTD